MEINERFITEVVVHICQGISGAMVYIGLESKRYMLCFFGAMVAVVMVSGIAHGEINDCYGSYDEKCLCEYNKRTKAMYIVCPTREKSNFAGRNVTSQMKRKEKADKGVSLLRMNDHLIATKTRR